MPAELLDGRKVAEEIHGETRRRVELLNRKGIEPRIVFVRVGEDAASQVYVGMKDRKAKELGIRAETIVFPEKTTEAELLKKIEKLNQDALTHGILVQSPLPSHISETKIFGAVSPQKDVDGFHPINVGKLLLGDASGFRPCTPAGVHELLIRCGVQIEEKDVVILGRGNIVGKPLAAILCQKQKNANATVTILHSRTQDIPSHTRRADILIAAMGQAEFVKADMIKKDAVVVDVGVNRIADASSPKGYRLVGDVDFKNVCEVASRITPNPGGVGPMTIAMLMANTVRAAGME
ncbi:MAG: bifunctional 5,10-methylenetetrahydrofolate dehydrogenase/5,10-methenyltetrahydrofolate cyclohydrolase [Verrucomicrobiota bacterium]